MTTPTQTLPERLRLAAEIIEKLLSWEYEQESAKGHWVKGSNLLFCISQLGTQIRIAFPDWPTLQPGDSWHNPANLTREQFGAEYRPLTVKEQKSVKNSSPNRQEMDAWVQAKWDTSQWKGGHSGQCYRLPIAHPWLFPAEPKMVPLEPIDIPPGSVFRHHQATQGLWIAPSEVAFEGLLFWSKSEDDNEGENFFLFYTKLQQDYLILRPGTTEWTSCEKPSTEF